MNRNIWFIGDGHGYPAANFKRVPKGHTVIALGDVGMGFNPPTEFEKHGLPVNYRFLRGNHDNPAVCKEHPFYLGDFGYNEEFGIFYISGGFSIDRKYRVFGQTWWEDEELGYLRLQDMIDLYMQVKPEIVVSHVAPAMMVDKYFEHKPVRRTEYAMQYCIEQAAPRLWLSGHYHMSLSYYRKDMLYRALDINELVPLDGLLQ